MKIGKTKCRTSDTASKSPLLLVYDDHIWFSNPGGLPEGITVEQLKRPEKFLEKEGFRVTQKGKKYSVENYQNRTK